MNDRYLLQYVSKQLKTIIRQYTLEGKITEKFTYCDQMKDEFGEMEIYNLFIYKKIVQYLQYFCQADIN